MVDESDDMLRLLALVRLSVCDVRVRVCAGSPVLVTRAVTDILLLRPVLCCDTIV